MQKIFCDICKQEIKLNGRTFQAVTDKLQINVIARFIDDEVNTAADICLNCTIKAVNKEATKLTKRSYTKRVSKKEPVVVPGIVTLVDQPE